MVCVGGVKVMPLMPVPVSLKVIMPCVLKEENVEINNVFARKGNKGEGT